MSNTSERKKASNKAWRIKNRHKVRAYKAWGNNPHAKDYWYRRVYGINLEDVENLRDKQEGRCAICRRLDRVLGVDHDHVTGVVRGLLCRQCNTGIGLLGDDPETLQVASQYLLQVAAHIDLRRKTDSTQAA